MKTDRELLELAAKAAGYGCTEWSDCIDDHDSNHYGGAALHEKGVGGQCRAFNSLTDDGDAFRLAANLNMLVDFYSECARPLPDGIAWQDGGGGDIFASARRVVTLAAAAIAETVQQNELSREA